MRRDRITLAMIIGIPVMQLLLFGYAINTNLRDLSAGIADQSRTAASRALVMDIVATGVVTRWNRLAVMRVVPTDEAAATYAGHVAPEIESDDYDDDEDEQSYSGLDDEDYDADDARR